MASKVLSLDSDWLRAHPLPVPDLASDKNSRGRVLAIGGCTTVPGGIQLTVEAALRAGAGKIQIATIDSAALALGLLGLGPAADLPGEADEVIDARGHLVMPGMVRPSCGPTSSA